MLALRRMRAHCAESGTSCVRRMVAPLLRLSSDSRAAGVNATAASSSLVSDPRTGVNVRAAGTIRSTPDARSHRAQILKSLDSHVLDLDVDLAALPELHRLLF